MGNRVRDVYNTLLSSNKYDNETKMAISHRILKCITREQEQLEDNLFLRVDNLEDSENMSIIVWSNIYLPHEQKVKNERSFTDEELLDFLHSLVIKENQPEASHGMQK